MSNEELRKYVIYLLKNSKVYYITQDKEIRRIYDKDEVERDKKVKNESYNILMNQRAMNMILYGEGSLEVPIEGLMCDLTREYSEIFQRETFDIRYDDSLDEVAEKIKNIGKDDIDEDEEDQRKLDTTLLYKLRANKQLGIKDEYDFIKNNAK